MKNRLDIILVERQLVSSRQRAKALIMAGKVLVDDRLVDKPGIQVDTDAKIVIRGEDNPYVSRGGLKLAGAIEQFGLDVTGKVCMDVGASTGGFTDCLLQHGASKVFAIDVGYGQLAWELRGNDRVVVIERTNIRKMNPVLVTDPVELATIDVSFISLKIVVPSVKQFIGKNASVIALIKPQFEVGKDQVGKGVVRDPMLHEEVIESLSDFFSLEGFIRKGVVPSPILGPKGNREFFIWLEYP